MEHANNGVSVARTDKFTMELVINRLETLLFPSSVRGATWGLQKLNRLITQCVADIDWAKMVQGGAIVARGATGKLSGHDCFT